MRRMSAAAAALVLAVGLGSEAYAQDTMGRRISRFDVGVYAGGSLTSPWFESRTVTVANGEVTEGDDGEGYTPGYAPAFGAMATYWATPGFGVRIHGAYLPMRRPFQGSFGATTPDEGDDDSWALNTYLYDLDLVFRPFVMSPSGMLSSVYFFLGGGGLTTDVAGSRPGCDPATLSRGACLTFDPEFASVGQGTLGAGMDLFRIGSGVALFGELGLHGYDSPVHVGDAWVPPARVPTGGSAAVADDRFAVTGRLVAGLKFMFGDMMPPPPVIVPPPPVAVVPPPPPAEPAMQAIRVCVVEGTALREVEAMYDPATGDTVVAGQPFATAYPATAGYAAGATWYINNEPITLNGRRYVRFGLPRVVGTTEVARTAEYQGVGVFTEATATGTPDVIYVPVRPGCEFQPYQYEVPARGVRG
ncbi:MAG: hypothetical protein AB1941_27970 [Gemmatimonadota bacterium]